MSRTVAGVQNQHSFSVAPVQAVPRSKFKLDEWCATNIDAGIGYPMPPIFCQPGDTYSGKVKTLVRVMALRFPVMAQLMVKWRAFFVPYRLVWNHWENMMGAQPEGPTQSIDYVVPWLTGSEGIFTVPSLSVGDYMDLPVEEPIDTTDWHISALPFRAYNLIYNTWIRDQDYQTALTVNMGDGPDEYPSYDLWRYGKSHDYFSSSRPSPQKGPSIPIPVTGMAPIYGDGSAIAFIEEAGTTTPHYLQGNAVGNSAFWNIAASATSKSFGIGENDIPGYNSHMYADVAQIMGNMNEMRSSVAIQQVYEQLARTGSYYVDILGSFFGIPRQDDRLQRPEYIGGGADQIMISSVAQTAPTTEDSPQANLAAYGIGGNDDYLHYTCQEHGVILIIISVTTPLVYQQRIRRQWLRSSRFDFPWPQFAHLGEQAVMQSEIYFPPTSPETVFGYQERYAEERYSTACVTGLMRYGVPNAIPQWNLALNYASPPVHDSDWIEDDPPVDRAISVPDGPHFLLNYAWEGSKTTTLPVFGTPGLDHF